MEIYVTSLNDVYNVFRVCLSLNSDTQQSTIWPIQLYNCEYV